MKRVVVFGSCLALVRLAALWYVVAVAHHSSGRPQIIGYLLQVGLMLPEAYTARGLRNDFPAWTLAMFFLLIVSSYSCFLLPLGVHRLFLYASRGSREKRQKRNA